MSAEKDSVLKVDFTYDENPVDRDCGPTVLILDDEKAGRGRARFLCANTSNPLSIRVLDCATISEAIEILSRTPVHVVLLDKDIVDNKTGVKHNGIEAIPSLLHLQPHLQILVITGSGQIQDAVRSIQFGALGYVTKETKDDLLIAQINRAIKVARLHLDKIRAERSLPYKNDEMRLVGKSKAMQRLATQVHAVSESNRPVLLLGKTGTGKTTIANIIHDYRKEYLKQEDRPFFALNLSAIPTELVERELFGNDAGAFTGALKAKQGFLELVNNGTLFLDEVGELSPKLQVKLLKVLEEGKFRRVGGTQEYQSSFKLVCATNRDLKAMVKRGEFREDLFFRISTFIVNVPSLEERREDIPDIIRSLLPQCCKENRVFIDHQDIPKDFIDFVTTNIPPGNIRGIEQQLSRLLIYSPKDKSGRPILTHWKEIRELQQSSMDEVESKKSVLTNRDLYELPFDVVDSDFPGLKRFLAKITEKVIADARKKYPRHVDTAAALKISSAMLSLHKGKIASAEKPDRRIPELGATDEVLQ